MPEKLAASVRQRVLNRDDRRCRKCSREQALEVHHILARMDGGTDDEANLATLCYTCHLEWHMVEAAYRLSFADWLQLPTYDLLLAVYQQLPDDLRHAGDTVWEVRRKG